MSDYNKKKRMSISSKIVLNWYRILFVLLYPKILGASRGFAFVEFSTEEEATRWMEYKQVSSIWEHFIYENLISKIQNDWESFKSYKHGTVGFIQSANIKIN